MSQYTPQSEISSHSTAGIYDPSVVQYYQSCVGERISVRIDLPPGSYRAAFEWRIEDPGSTDTIGPILRASSEERASEEVSQAHLSWQPAAPATVQLQNKKREFSWQSRWILSSVLLSLFAGLSASALWRTTHSNFDRFWSPMSSKSKPVLICMGSNIVYELSHEYMVRYLQDHRLAGQSLSSFVDLPPNASIFGRDLQPAHNSFVALGDVAAVSDVVATLTKQGRTFQQRFPPDISFAELKDTPTILVGGFNNPLTIALTKDSRFVLSQSSRIEDRQKPGKFWSVEFHGDARDTEDYAIVSRLINSSSGGPVISIAGIGQYGTQAAAEFVGNPETITKLLNDAPRGWSSKNMQVVLHVKILDFRPVSTDVVGISFW